MSSAPRNLITAGVLCLALACLVGAGCGGKSNGAAGDAKATSPGATTTATSKGESSAAATDANRQFIAKADAACRRVNGELRNSKAKGSKPAQLAALVVANETIERKGVKKLSKLTAPAPLAEPWKMVLIYREELANELARLAHAVRRHDTGPFARLQKAKKEIRAKLAAEGNKFGFKDCARTG
jgi:hypothetical protein